MKQYVFAEINKVEEPKDWFGTPGWHEITGVSADLYFNPDTGKLILLVGSYGDLTIIENPEEYGKALKERIKKENDN